ncbi:MAG TPA: ATP-binding protein [Acidimicrobiales bacterium]|nr:ATP-binding protein [Acidimicrobiales bacterium]
MEGPAKHLRLERSFPPRPDACPKVREFVRQALTAMGLARLVPDCELLAGEMAVNAVFHARTYFSVVVERPRARTARIEVHDQSHDLPRRKPSTDGDPLILGRGMQIIAEVPDRSGVESTASGKCVWVEVDG